MSFTFYADCPACGQRLKASSNIALREKGEAHVKKCFPRAKKKIDAAAAEAAQGDLFGKPDR